MGDFNERGLDGLSGENSKEKETVHYIGDLRIVGQVVERINDKNPIGYVVMAERTQRFKMYTINQTISLLKRYKFVNAELKDNKVINTECAMSRMPKYSPNMRVVDNFGIIILGEIVSDNRTTGYRALDTNGRIADLTEQEVIDLSNKVEIINAKIVNKNDKNYVSAIKNEFTKIEKSKLKSIIDRGVKPGDKWRKVKHLEKLRDKFTMNAMKYIFTGHCSVVNDELYCRYPAGKSGQEGRYIALNREAMILAKELYTPSNNIQLSKEDVLLYKDICKGIPHSIVIGDIIDNKTGKKTYVSMNDYDKKFIVAISQFILNNKEKREEILKYINKHGLFKSYASEFYSSNYASKAFKEVYNQALKNEAEAEERLKAESSKREFKTKTFKTAKEIAQLGFAVTEQNRGYKFKTDTGYTKTLLYLGDVIGEDYNKYREKARCLGDLAAIAYVEKLMNKFDTYNMRTEDKIAVMEMIIAISYMFNSEAMRDYAEFNRVGLSYLGVNVPDYDEIAGIDYQLSPEIKMYYTSGFNVFLNDGRFTREHLRKSKIINYRQAGINHIITHPMLTNDLASVVNMITSDNCEAEQVEKLIGQLRFL